MHSQFLVQGLSDDQTLIEANIWGFQTFGFDNHVEAYPILFHEEKLRTSPGFRETWSLDFPVEKLSARHRNERFGWINQPE
jgi:hypothetical protein